MILRRLFRTKKWPRRIINRTPAWYEIDVIMSTFSKYMKDDLSDEDYHSAITELGKLKKNRINFNHDPYRDLRHNTAQV